MEEVVAQIQLMQQHMVVMQEKLATLDVSPKVEEYPEVRITVTNVKDISLDMFKSLPVFDGERDKYISWRTAAINAMCIFAGHMHEPKYFEALNIVRNKVTGSASEAITNYNTVFNFDAIISRLDFTYADKRPIYIIEQEMIVLQQKNLSIEDFYDCVNKKLNTLINKINMTHKERSVACAMVQDASEKALRTFVTGLKGDLGRILYASDPSNLPEAYAKVQTISNDQERIRFANQFNRPQHVGNDVAKFNPNFKPKPKMPYQQPSSSQNNRYDSPMRNNKPEPMEVDRSSMNVNVGLQKRQSSGQHSFSHNRKFQRVNQMENQKSDVEDPPNNDEDDTTSEGLDESGDETSSVFLDN